MFLLFRSHPLIISLPKDEEASQDFLKDQLYEEEAAYHEALIIADRLAKVPAIETSETSFCAAITSHDVILCHNQEELLQIVGQGSTFAPYWLFSLSNGKASPLKRQVSHILEASHFVPNEQVARLCERLDAAKVALRRESLDSSCEVPEEDIVTSPSYRGKLEEEIDQRTAELKVLLDKYEESVRLSAKEKLLSADHCLNMLLDTDTTVVRILFSSRPDNHAARIANNLTNAYHTSWGD